MTDPLAILLLNMGGPDSLQSVREFLRQLFSDPAIIHLPLPAITQPLFARAISRLRAPKVRRQYAAIGGRSPLRALTQAQAIALRATLRRRGIAASVAVAMRYAHPTTEEALAQLAAQAPHAPLVVLPLYPQYSSATTGSSLRAVVDGLHRIGGSRPTLQKSPFSALHTVSHFYDRPAFIDALAERIDEVGSPAFRRNHPLHLLCSAHGLPQSFVQRGDPYIGQIEKTVELLRQRFPELPIHLAYQSRVGPVKWVGPSAEEKIGELARQQVKSLLVAPISFVSDHLETLYEIDVTYTQLARRLGIENFRRIRSLNASPTFINLLADLVSEQVR